MLGRVAFINPATRTGLIFGADRKRYTFALSDWSEAVPPGRNQEVNFLVQDGRVTAIRPLTDDFLAVAMEPEPEPVVEAPRPKAPRAGTPELPLQAIGSFRGQMEFGADPTPEPEEDAAADDFLDHGEAFPELTEPEPEVRPQMGKLLFTQPDARSSRVRWLPYGAAAAAIAALVAVGDVVLTHL